MPADDSSTMRRWKRIIVPAEMLGKLAKGEITASHQLKGAKFLGATFYHEHGIIAMFFERADFPETKLGDEFPSEELQPDPVVRIFH